jgi:hypothetical protein
MTWLALLLVGAGVADLVNRPTAPRVLPEAVGAAVVVVLGLLAGLAGGVALLGLVLVAAAVVGWSRTASLAFDRGRPWLPLLVLGGAIALALASSGLDGVAGGPLASWWQGLAWPLADRVPLDRALLVVGVMLVQLSTANVIVRLVLASTGTSNPARRAAAAAADPADPAHDLKGGRLLGPMERLLIVGLGLAGNLTAASIVVAAKGLLRFPELSSSKEDQEQLHRLTEYFLVGSFVSWTIALGSMALLAR